MRNVALLSIFIVFLTFSSTSVVLVGNPDATKSFTQSFSHVILFSWDGVQYNHLMELYDTGRLPSLKQLINETSLPILKALMTDHYTETNYGHPSLLSGKGQGAAAGCPDNVTIWENVETWDGSWVTGSIAGKSKFSDQIFPYAKDDVDYWYAADVNADVVASLATEFIRNYKADSFFLFIHYRDPDISAHSYGENSQQYENAIITCDNQTGRIMATLEAEGILDSTAVLITTDHGFIEDGTGHSGPAWGAAGADPDKYTIWIACSAGEVSLDDAANEFWDQNDLAPTVYSLMGLNDYGGRWPYIRGSALWDRAFDIRDVAATEVKLSRNVISDGNVYIDVFIENQGNYTEIPTVSVHYNNTLVESKTLAYPDVPLFGDSRDASSQKITFTWNTENIPVGAYMIKVNIDVVPANEFFQPNMTYTKNETDTADNILYDGWVYVTIPGDLDANGKVNIIDLVKIAVRFGEVLPQPVPWPHPVEDTNSDGIISILDIEVVASHFGETG